MKKISFLPVCGIAVAGIIMTAGCTSVPVTGRSHLSGLVSDTEVVKLSVEQFEQMKAQYPISRNAQYHNMLQRVGERIAEVAQFDILNADWEFVVFDDATALNAFAMAGGKVGVFTGLFDVIETDDDLAIVIGHEIAHVAAKHVHERLSKAMLGQGLGLGMLAGFGGVGTASSQVILQSYGMGSQAVGLGFNRQMEKEADHIGLMYAARAGYDPRSAFDLWERMDAQAGANAPLAFSSTHPSYGSRISQLREIMPDALRKHEIAMNGGPGEDIIIIE
jgi:predicted Zn-dependent protease